MSAKPILYSYFRSSCSWRVRIALALKNIDYEYKAVHLVQDGGDQNKEEFRKINPMGQVPVLIVGQEILTESMAIIEFLDELYPEPHLIPREPFSKAKVRSISEVIVSGIQPVQNLGVLMKLDENKRLGWAQHFIEKGFTALESMLSGTCGKYCVGDEISLADVCLVPQVYNAERFKVDISKYSNIARINATLLEHPAFKVSHPSCQPDTPDGQRS